MSLSMLPPQYIITCQVGGALAINPDRTEVGAQVILSEPSQHSVLQRWSLYSTPKVQGTVIYNPTLNLYAAPKSNNDGAEVVLYYFDPRDDFSGRTWQICGDDNSVIRMQVNDGLNMNASGGSFYPGTPIIVYSWSGPKDNMLWTTKLIEAAAAPQAA